MVTVPSVDSVYGMPTCSATDTTACSPSVCISRVNPMGANTNGSGLGRPRIVVSVCTAETSCSTEGRNSTRR